VSSAPFQLLFLLVEGRQEQSQYNSVSQTALLLFKTSFQDVTGQPQPLDKPKMSTF